MCETNFKDGQPIYSIPLIVAIKSSQFYQLVFKHIYKVDDSFNFPQSDLQMIRALAPKCIFFSLQYFRRILSFVDKKTSGFISKEF